MEITTEDFDKAVSMPWGTETCVVAQAFMREGLQLYLDGNENPSYPLSAAAKDFMHKFDSICACELDPTREERLAGLRELLPITL